MIGSVVDDADEDAVRKFAQRCDINYPIAMTPDEMRVQFGSAGGANVNQCEGGAVRLFSPAVREKLSKVTESGEHKPVIYV